MIASIPEYHSVARPFKFVSCLELREVLGKWAMDIARLLELVEDVALDSIYCIRTASTCAMRTLKRRIPTTSRCGRLGVLDPFAYLSLEGLRQEIIAIIDDHLSSPTS